MWCADCEEVKGYIFDKTRFFLFLPTIETVAKVKKMCDSINFTYEHHQSHCISVEIPRESIELFLMAMFGELNGPERFNTKMTTTSGTTDLDYESIGKIISADIFINRYKGLWIVDSVRENRYETWFQPIVDANKLEDPSNRNFAHEALFRIRDDRDQIIPPGHVFSVAAHSDLLFSLDLTARRSAIEHAAAAQLGTKIFVNFDPSSIYDPSYCLRTTAAAIAEAGLKNQDVVFEVTEMNKAKNISHLKGILSFYRNEGFQVALDDIGAGWSGLNLLNELMPDYVKIDMDLIRGIDRSESQQKIVKHLIAGAKDNGIKVISEGVETAEEAACVKEFGSDYLQGYYFGRPELKAALPKS